MDKPTSFKRKKSEKQSGSDIEESILRRLLTSPYLLEESAPRVGLTKYEISKGFGEDTKSIGRTSRKDHFKILMEEGLIKELFRKRYNTGEDSVVYDITSLGLVKWLGYIRQKQNHNDKETTFKDLEIIERVIECSSRLLPWINENWKTIRELFSMEYGVKENSRNIKAIFGLDYGIKANSRNIKELFSMEYCTSTLLFVADIKISTHHYNHFSYCSASSRISSLGSEIMLNDTTPFPPNTEDKTMICSDATNKMVGSLFTFLVIFHLLRLLEIDHNKSSREKREADLIALIKSSPRVYEDYKKFTGKIEYALWEDYNYIQNLNKRCNIVLEKTQYLKELEKLEN